MNTIERFLGTYDGTGSWHDAAGKSMSYRIRQTNSSRDEGFDVAFHHDFDDGDAEGLYIAWTERLRRTS